MATPLPAATKKPGSAACRITIPFYLPKITKGGGLAMAGRSSKLEEYRYGFNGKERYPATEWGQTSYDYGFRIYNPEVARWLSIDPLTKDYPFVSPYNFALNTPIQALDPDGQLVIFVNGFRLDAYEEWLIRTGQYKANSFKTKLDQALRGFTTVGDAYAIDLRPPWEQSMNYINYDVFEYWEDIDNQFYFRFTGIEDLYNGTEQNYYVDGMNSPNSSAQTRYDAGVKDGEAILEKINNGDIQLKTGETVKVIGHSHGGWHARGTADFLAKNGIDVAAYYGINVHQPTEDVKRLEDVPDYLSVQFARKTDALSSTNSSGKVESIPLKLFGKSVFGFMKDVDEEVTMKDTPKAPLGGHFLEEADEIFKIPKGYEGYIRKNGEL